MALRWDSKKVASLRARIAELHDGSFQRKANRACGAAAVSLVDEGFVKSQDPYGRAWAPIKRDGMPLLDTGRLAASYSYKADAKGFVVHSNVVYAATHNYGRGYIKQRRMVPDATNLPGSWKDAFKATVTEMLQKKFAGLR